MTDSLKKNYSISIVIPTYNEQDNISNCLDSVLKQNYDKSLIDVVIVDGQSSYKTVSKINEYQQKFPNISLLENPVRKTPTSLNIGIRSSSCSRPARAYYAPAAGVHEMVDSIVRDRKKILPCSVYLQGEFGLSDVWVGVPCRLGRAGMEGVFEIKLTASEQAQLAKSAGDVKAQMAKLPAELGAA